MDRHSAPGISLSEALVAHERDVAIQGKHECRARTFWLDEARGFINCLVEAPSKEAVISLHAEAHGQLPSEIVEVHPDVVLAFLGRLDDLPIDVAKSGAPTDSAFRSVLFTDLKDSTALTTRYGDARAMEFVRIHDSIVRNALTLHRGREIKHTGDGIMASFGLPDDSIWAAVAIQRGFAEANATSGDGQLDVQLHVRIGISAGEPLCQNNDLFGTSVQLAARLCAHAEEDEILVSETLCAAVREAKALLTRREDALLKGFDAAVQVFAVDWRGVNFPP